jgi:hypothetical protein
MVEADFACRPFHFGTYVGNPSIGGNELLEEGGKVDVLLTFRNRFVHRKPGANIIFDPDAQDPTMGLPAWPDFEIPDLAYFTELAILCIIEVCALLLAQGANLIGARGADQEVERITTIFIQKPANNLVRR